MERKASKTTLITLPEKRQAEQGEGVGEMCSCRHVIILYECISFCFVLFFFVLPIALHDDIATKEQRLCLSAFTFAFTTRCA